VQAICPAFAGAVALAHAHLGTGYAMFNKFSVRSKIIVRAMVRNGLLVKSDLS
jgi:hypothetical protein